MKSLVKILEHVPARNPKSQDLHVVKLIPRNSTNKEMDVGEH
jgi:hypothetical protein